MWKILFLLFVPFTTILVVMVLGPIEALITKILDMFES